jgi:DNA-binding transcriptional MocR family regulator
VRDRKYAAYSKALLLRDCLREAARTEVSPIAQAILAILIAESWPIERTQLWSVQMSHSRLATRLGRSKSTIKRAIAELKEVRFVRVLPGRIKTVSRFVIDPWFVVPDRSTSEPREGSQVSPQRVHQRPPMQQKPEELFRRSPNDDQRRAYQSEQHPNTDPAMIDVTA